MWTAEQAQEWLNSMQPDPPVAPSAHAEGAQDEGTYPQIDVSAAEGTYDVTSHAEGAPDDITATEGYPEIQHAGTTGQEADAQQYGESS